MMGYQNKGYKLLAMLLALSMLLSLVPDVFAEDQSGEVQHKIVAFTELDKEISSQVVSPGTELAELKFPDTLTADVIEDIENSEADDSASADVQNTIETEVPVSWESEPGYDPETQGVYTFSATLEAGYTLIGEAEPPSITVIVISKEVMGVPSFFEEFKIRIGSAGGEIFYDFLDDTGSVPNMQTGTSYYLSVKFNKPASVDAVQIRLGNSSDQSANGLYYISTPGDTMEPKPTPEHGYFSELLKYVDYNDPKYGADVNSTISSGGKNPLTIEDGELTYQIAGSIDTGGEVYFTIGFQIDEAFNDGTGEILDAIGISLGQWNSSSFIDVSAYSSSLDFKLASRKEAKANFGNTARNADLGGKSEYLTLYALNNMDTSVPTAAIYEQLTFDITYPSKVTIDESDIMFNMTTRAQYSGSHGLIDVGSEVTDPVNKTTTRTITIYNGYMSGSPAVTLYFYVSVPAGSYQDGEKFTVSVSNVNMVIGGEDVGIPTPSNGTVTITIIDPSKDSTSISALNKNVYNSTNDFGNGETYGTIMGGTVIKNGSGTATPYEKTIEASYNTTGTDAMITSITIPKGSRDFVDMEITLTGKDANGAVISKILTTDELNNAVKYTTYCIVLLAKDYGMETITGVKADIGNLTGNYSSNTSSASWLFTSNFCAAWGYFTTDAAGIVVKNKFNIYNTDVSHRNLENGDLSVTTSTTSIDSNRVSPVGSYTDVKINNTSMSTSNTNVMVSAGSEAKIAGILGVYGAPQACYASSGNLATSTLIADPEIYLLLPDGISYNAASLSFTLNSYNPAGTKTGSSSLSYQVDNVSYLNTEGDGVSIYRISFPAGTCIGCYGADAIQYKIEYNIPLTTSRSLETADYYLNELIQVSSANNFSAAYAGSGLANSATVNTVKTDTYGINGGNNLAGISVGADGDSSQLSFTLQQQEEISVSNAVSVTKINGQDVTESWYSYDTSNPNSIAMLGANSEGRMRITINNTATYDGTDIVAVLPIPKAGSDLGNAFMDAAPEFSMSMTFNQTEVENAGCTAKYIILSGSYDSVGGWDYTETTNKDLANAILLTANSISKKTSVNIYLNFAVESGTADAQNIWCNAFTYNLNNNSYSSTGNYVASGVANGHISGVVYFDENFDGIMDAGESGVPGVTVTITDQYDRILSTTTDGNGKYEFLAVREASQDMTFTLDTSYTAGRFNVQYGTDNTVTNSSDGLNATKKFIATDNTTINAAVSSYYTLEYDAGNNGSGTVPKSVTGASGTDITVSTKPDSLVRIGYTFKEWNTDNNGDGISYTPGSTLTLTADTTLYAIWTIGSYTISFNYRGATGGNTEGSRTMTHNETYSGLPSPTRTGYTFDAWYTLATGGSKIIDGSTKFTSGADTTIYAQWKANTYDIVFDGNGSDGGNSMADQSMTYDVSEKLNANEYTLTGYDFAGWNTEADGTGYSYADEISVSNLADSGNVTLYAQWTPKTGFTVNYDLNDGSSTLFDSVTVSWTDSVIHGTNPTSAGNSFQGWSETPGGTAISNNTTYADLVNNDDSISTAVLYAIWTPISGTEKIVHFDSQGGTSVNDATLLDETIRVGSCIPAANPTRVGYTFDEWNTAADGTGTAVTSNGTDTFNELTNYSGANEMYLYAQWTAITYTIQFEGNGSDSGSVSDLNMTYDTEDNLTKNNFTRTGYEFDGWSTSAAGGVVYTDEQRIINLASEEGTVYKLYAHWKENTYDIYYYSDVSEWQETLTGVKYSSTAPPSRIPAKTGYSFKGWNADPAAVTGILDISSTTIAAIISNFGLNDKDSSITLYATWEEKGGYTVNYYSQNILEHTESGVTWKQSGLDTSAPTLTRKGYELSGWTSGSTAVQPGTTYGSLAGSDQTMSISLSAIWTAKSYIIEYEDPVGENLGTSAAVLWTGSVLSNAPSFTRTGYSLSGWQYGSSNVASNATVSSLIQNDDVGDTLTLTAVWKANGYTIKFDGNGSDGGGSSMSDLSMTYDLDGNLTKNDFTRTGYTFGGWNTSSDGTGIPYADEELVKNLSTGNDVILYAQWTVETYTISYELNDDTASPASNPASNPTSYTYGDVIEVTSVTAASRTGYDFGGWYTNSGLTMPFAGIGAADTGNKTLYAKWTASTYTISYELNDDTANPASNPASNPTSYTYGDEIAVTSVAAASRTGYDFGGWYTNSGLTNPFLGIGAADTGNKTLYAKWTKSTYTISYELNDDTTSPASNPASNPTSYTYGDEIVVTSVTAASRTGYDFGGWYTNSGLTIPFLGIGATDTGNQTLYAKWTKSTYTISYELNDDTTSSAINPASNPTSYTYGDVIEVTSVTAASRSGYDFGGWYTNIGLTIPFAGIGATDTGNKILYAKWTASTYTISYELNDDISNPASNPASNPTSYTYGDVIAVTSVTAASRSGYDFGGWYTDSGLTIPFLGIGATDTGNQTLYAKWTKSTYTISYELNDDTNSPAINPASNPTSYIYGDVIEVTGVTAASRAGYDFGGWYTDSVLTIPFTGIGATDTGTKTLYAKWTACTYNITYKLDGGKNDSRNPSTYTYGVGVTNFHDATSKTGYTFDGWYDAATGGTKITSIAATATGSITLYAHWTAKIYTVEFKDDSGANPATTVSVTWNDLILSSEPLYTRIGYTHSGWKCDSTDVTITTKYSDLAANDNTGITLIAEAQWTEKSYTIKYDNAEGCTDTTSKWTESLTLPEPSARTGYTFECWTYNGNKVKTSDTVSGLIPNDDAASDTLTLTAVWTANANIYTITYELDGGTNHSSNPTSYTEGVGVTSLVDAAKTGYTFGGWYSDSAFTNKVTKIEAAATGDITLYAKWTVNIYTVEFIDNSGENADITISVAWSDFILSSAPQYTRSGYTLSGWKCGSTEVTDNTKYSDLAANAVRRITLVIEAQWTEKSYTIKYEDAEGCIDTTSKWTEKVALPTPTRAGYTFDYWTYNSEEVKTNTTVSTLIPKDDAGTTLTLTARWTAKSYTVYYVTDGGSSIDAKKVEWTDTGLLPSAVPSKSGYTFNGWKCGNKSVTNDTAYSDLAANDTEESITLKVQWTENKPVSGTYYVTYIANGGTGFYYDSGLSYGSAAAVKSAAETNISRTGYVFAGWNTAADGTGTYYNAGDILTVTSDVVLYAQWTESETKPTAYTVVYTANGGKGCYADTELPDGTIHNVKSAAEINISREGYDFTGWNTAADGTGTYYDETSVITVKLDIVLYAQWTKNDSESAADPEYNVIYAANGGTGFHSETGLTYGTTDTVNSDTETNITREGYTFTGWNTEPDGSGTAYEPNDTLTITSDIALFAQWSPMQIEPEYTVFYTANGGTGIYADTGLTYDSTYTVKSDTETGITREGYIFTGWNTAADGTGTPYAAADTITIKTDISLVAQWTKSEPEPEPDTYTITYTANGGTGSYADTGLSYDSAYTVKTADDTGITREGYTFKGWNTDPNGKGTAYKPNDLINVTSDITLAAQWTKDGQEPEPDTYTITYTANGGTGSYADTGLSYNYTYVVKSSSDTGITREGYTFTGWNTDPAGNGTDYVPNDLIMITSDITLSAQWTKDGTAVKEPSEKTDPPVKKAADGSKTSEAVGKGKTGSSKTAISTKTGDDSMIEFYQVILVISGGVLIAFAVYQGQKKKRHA